MVPDWKWQLANSISTIDKLKESIDLKDDELDYFKSSSNHLNFRITPYFLDVVKKDKTGALRKTVIPSVREFDNFSCDSNDPLNEEKFTKFGVVHKYPDRCLFLVTDFCASVCRFCTRSRLIDNGTSFDLDKAIYYVENNKKIRDVILSGGDPLTLGTDRLIEIISRLYKIKHVEVIRIGTKVPVVLPQRIDKELLACFKKYKKKLWININLNHPSEVTPEFKKACFKIICCGVPVGSQTVLLKGVNDSSKIMKKLMQLALISKVRPLYLYLCDHTAGTYHFRTTIETGLNIIHSLIGWTSGLAVPHFVIDAPDGFGKIPVLPDYCVKSDNGKFVLKNYMNDIYYYSEIGDM